MRRAGLFDSDGRPIHTIDRAGKRVRDDNTDDATMGFQPKAYTSSRSNRATASHKMYDRSSIMDYMDESDGLLGGKLASLEGLDSFVKQASNISTISQKTATTNNHHPINQRVSTDPSSHQSAIAHATSSSSSSIGKKLLATMGWKLGHGIGPRMSSRRKSKKAATDIASSSSSSLRGRTADANDDDSVHLAVDLSKLPVASIIDSNNRIVSFAPSEVTITIPSPKVDIHGIGFVNKDCLDGGGIQSSIFGNNGMLQSRRKSRYDIGFTYEDDDVLNDMYDGEALLRASSDVKSTGALITSSSHNDISSSSSSISLSSSKLLQYSNEVQDVDEDSDDDDDDYNMRGKKNNLGGREKLVDVARNIQNWTKHGHKDDSHHPHQQHQQQQQRVTLGIHKSDEDDGLGYLNGFCRPIAMKVVPYHYPPPVVPLDFDDRHRFDKPIIVLKDDVVAQGPHPTSLEEESCCLVNNRMKSVDAVQSRANILSGNTSIPAIAPPPLSTPSSAAAAVPSVSSSSSSSVFDLLKPADRIKIQNINAMTRGVEFKPPLPPPTIDPPPPPPLLPAALQVSLPLAASPPSSKEVEKPRPMLSSSSSILANSTFAALSQTFKNRFAPASNVSSSTTTTAKEGISTAADYSKAASTTATAAIDQPKANGGTTTSIINNNNSNNNNSNNNNSNNSSSSTVLQQLIEIKSELKITKCVRTTTLWAPASLLCKRFNVKVPTQPSSSHLTQAVITGMRGSLNLDEQVKTMIDARVDQSTKNSSLNDDHRSEKQRAVEREDNDESADVYLRPAASRVNNSNPLSAFKSIFEDSDSSDSDSDSDDEDDQEDGDDDNDAGKEEREENEESLRRNDESAKFDSARTVIVGDATAIAALSSNKDVVMIDSSHDAITTTTTGQELKVVGVKYVKSSDRQTIAISRDGIGGRRNPLVSSSSSSNSSSSMHPPLSRLKKREWCGGIDSINALGTANDNSTNTRSVTDSMVMRMKSETAEKRRFHLSFSSEEIDDDEGITDGNINNVNINNINKNNKKVKHTALVNHRRSDNNEASQEQLSARSIEQEKDCVDGRQHHPSSRNNTDIDISDGVHPLQSSITTNQPHHRPLSDTGAVPHYILDRFTQHPFSSTANDDDDGDDDNNNNINAKVCSRVMSGKSSIDTTATLFQGASISKLETYLHNKDDIDDDDDDDSNDVDGDNDSGGKRRKQSKKNKHSKKSKRSKDNKHKDKKERHKSEKKKKKKKSKKMMKAIRVSSDSSGSSSSSSSGGGDSDDD